MIKALAARTDEVDDADLAVGEIFDRLGISGGKNLMRNSIGIIACHLDFINSGVVGAICERAPFDVVGVSTLGSATADEGGELILSMVVLTSDDVSFSAGLSGSLERGCRRQLEEMYRRTFAGLPGRPKLMITFAPSLFNTSEDSVSGDEIVRILDSISGSVPMFGTLPSDFTTHIRSPMVLFNGRGYADSCAIVLMSGNINPRFKMTQLSERKVLKRKAIVTASKGNCLKEINGAPAVEYVKSLGLMDDGKIVGAESIPLVIDYNDGTPWGMRALNSVTPEGFLILGGEARMNCSIGIGADDRDGVMGSASEVADAMAECDYDFLFVVSCVTRNFYLGFDTTDEMDLFRSKLGERAPFLFLYGGGEICPVWARNRDFFNRYHNLTLVCCAL
jgi:hypothetical protein